MQKRTTQLSVHKQLNDHKHTDFNVIRIEDRGNNKYEVHWSAMFGGMKYTDSLLLWADDELDAYLLVARVYGEKK